MKRCLRIAVLGFVLLALLGTGAIKPTLAVSNYRKLLTLGRGNIESAEWHPSGKRIVVNTMTGAWIYDDKMQDIAHLEGVRFARFNATGELMAAVEANQVVLFETITLKHIR